MTAWTGPIHKWPIEPMMTTDLPAELDVIHVGMQGGRYVYWTRTVSPEVAGQRGTRTMMLMPTGHEVAYPAVHLGTVVDDARGLVWHLFRSAV